MRITRHIALATVATLVHVGSAQSQSVSAGHREAARELLEITNSREMMQQSMELARQMLVTDSMQRAVPAEIDKLVDELFEEYFSWSVLEPDVVQLYVEMFSEAELRELTAFYRTELGQMMLERMPEVLQRSYMLTQTHLQRALPIMIERITAELNKRRGGR